MENPGNDFTDSMAYPSTLKSRHSSFNLQAVNPKEKEDEEDDENEDENEDKRGNVSIGTDDDNPPLDPDIRHSPVSPQPGGKPGGQ